MAEKDIEFMVDSVTLESDFLLVQGACNRGSICVGDKFGKAYKHELEEESDGGYCVSKQYNERSVVLTVEKIRAYGHDIDELAEGMTGELLLLGQGSEHIKINDLLGN